MLDSPLKRHKTAYKHGETIGSPAVGGLVRKISAAHVQTQVAPTPTSASSVPVGELPQLPQAPIAQAGPSTGTPVVGQARPVNDGLTSWERGVVGRKRRWGAMGFGEEEVGEMEGRVTK